VPSQLYFLCTRESLLYYTVPQHPPLTSVSFFPASTNNPLCSSLHMGILCSNVDHSCLGKASYFPHEKFPFSLLLRYLCMSYVFSFVSIHFVYCSVCLPHPLPLHSSFQYGTFSFFLGFPNLLLSEATPKVKLSNRRGNSMYFLVETATDPSLFKVQVLKVVITSPTT
jgi:hypothetical protein